MGAGWRPRRFAVRAASSSTRSGAPVERGRVEKMSKSKKNVIDSDAIVERYGADAARWFLLSDSPPERDLEWSEGGIEGAARFVQRVWKLAGSPGADGEDMAIERRRNQAAAAVTDALEGLQFNKAIAQLYEFVSAIEKAKPSQSRGRGDPHAGSAGGADGAPPCRGMLGSDGRRRNGHRRALAELRSRVAGR